MPIKTKLSALQSAVPALSRLGEARLPAKAAYSISKLLKSAQAELSLFEEQRTRLIKEHGTADEQGNYSIAPGTPQMLAFAAELGPLLETEVELPVNPLTLDLIERAELSAQDMLALDAFIVVAEEA